MSSVWRSYRRLSRDERRVVHNAAILLPLTAAGVRVLGFRRWREILERLWRGSATPPTQLGAEEVARLVSATARRLPFSTRCLERALALRTLLRRSGVACELRLGARKDSRGFAAHAWVECGGRRLDDLAGEISAGGDFVPFRESHSAASSSEHLSR